MTIFEADSPTHQVHPAILALEMIEDLEAALEQLRDIAEDVGETEAG